MKYSHGPIRLGAVLAALALLLVGASGEEAEPSRISRFDVVLRDFQLLSTNTQGRSASELDDTSDEILSAVRAFVRKSSMDDGGVAMLWVSHPNGPEREVSTIAMWPRTALPRSTSFNAWAGPVRALGSVHVRTGVDRRTCVRLSGYVLADQSGPNIARGKLVVVVGAGSIIPILSIDFST